MSIGIWGTVGAEICQSKCPDTLDHMHVRYAEPHERGEVASPAVAGRAPRAEGEPNRGGA